MKILVFPSASENNLGNWIEFKAGSTTTKGSIFLPLPQNLVFSTEMKYNDVSLGVIGGIIDSFNESYDNTSGKMLDRVIESGKDTFNGLAKTITESTKGQTSLQAALIAQAFQSTGMLPSEGLVGGLASKVAKKVLRDNRVAINPNTELYFDTVGLRSFNFNFRLAPKSPKDSETIQSIVKFFNRHSHPGFHNGSRYIFDYPEEWIITLYANGRPNDKLPAINKCVCTNVRTTYLENSNVLMSDDSASSVSVDVSFREIEINTRDTINRPQSDTTRFSKITEEQERIYTESQAIQSAVTEVFSETSRYRIQKPQKRV